MQQCSCCCYCCHHSTFATFRQAAATAASSSAATVAASLLTSLMISEYLMSPPSCTSAGFLLRMKGRSLCSMLPAEAPKPCLHSCEAKTLQVHYDNFKHLGVDNPILTRLSESHTAAVISLVQCLMQACSPKDTTLNSNAGASSDSC